MEALVNIMLRELLCIELLPQRGTDQHVIYCKCVSLNPEQFTRIESVHLHLIPINSGVSVKIFSVSYLHLEYSRKSVL